MKKVTAVILFVLITLTTFTACKNSTTLYKDGTYKAEFENYDSRGYKDFLEITVVDGIVNTITFDAMNENGTLRTQDEKYVTDMQPIQGTMPAQYSADLVNQYLSSRNIDEVVAVAGATISSNNFVKLFKAVEKPMINGNTDTIYLQNSSI